MTYAFTGVLFYFISLLDDGGVIIWRVIVTIPSIVLFGGLVLDMLMVKSLNSFTYLLQQQGYDSTLLTMRKVYEAETAKQLVMEFQQGSVQELPEISSV